MKNKAFPISMTVLWGMVFGSAMHSLTTDTDEQEKKTEVQHADGLLYREGSRSYKRVLFASGR